jgi:hypothetical protein
LCSQCQAAFSDEKLGDPCGVEAATQVVSSKMLVEPAASHALGFSHLHPQHPPDREYRDDGSQDVNYPVASSFRFSKIEHLAMVAGPEEG